MASSNFLEHIYVWTGLVIFVLFLVSAVGFGSPAWLSGHYGSHEYIKVGLVTRCYNDRATNHLKCSPFYLGSQAAWFEAARVLCSLAVVLLFTLVVASAFLLFVDGKRQDFFYMVIGGLLTSMLGILGCIVYAAKSEDLLDRFSGKLSWGWAVFLTAQLLTAIVVLFFFYLVKAKKRRPKLRPVAPLRDALY